MHPSPRELGNTGIRVSPIGLGGMPLSIAGRPDQAQAFEVIKAFVDNGGDFIDTANVYCMDDADLGHNERLIAGALRRLGKQAEITVATKGGMRRPGGAWTVDGSPRWLRAACEKSLKDLGVATITLYQLHAIDPNVDLAESVGELARLQAAGKILHIGLSNVLPEQLERALKIAPIISVQNRSNLFEKRDFDNGMVALCRKNSLAFIPHSPMGGHSGHVRLADSPAPGRIAKKHGVTPYQIALAWFLAKGEHIIPIPGASKTSSIVSSLRASGIRLTAEEISELDQVG